MAATPASNPPNAIDRARAAYELMVQRQKAAAAARRARERARNVKVSLVLGAAAALLLGLAVHQDWVPTLTPPVSSPAALADRLAEMRTGQVRTTVKGNTCRQLAFDNESGRFVGASMGPCDDVVLEDRGRKPAGALNSLRDAFAKQ